ncbi:MAG: hypothetical protein M3376_11000 [Actinomycetota bacterium]|nr:hypothetical protein [Actinomycetota bacterium]
MADAITHWNDVLLEVARQVGGPPGPIARGGAMMHAAMYDAVNSIAPSTHEPYVVSVPSSATASIEAAVAQAAHDALVASFPTTTVPLATRLSDVITALPATADVAGGEAVGTATAAAMIAERVGDGADDHTPYVNGTQPGDWRPTGNPPAPAASPNWPNVKPFVMPYGQSFRPPRPGGYASKTDNRVWRLGEAGELLPQVSVHPDGATIWHPGDVTAACRHGHVAPAPGCSCGLHAAYEPPDPCRDGGFGSNRAAYGAVACWGEIDTTSRLSRAACADRRAGARRRRSYRRLLPSRSARGSGSPTWRCPAS